MDIAEIPEWEGAWSSVLAAARDDSAAIAGAGALWAIYGPILTPLDRPLVIGQIGQSLDGRVATPTGHSHYINGPAALTHLHRLRALCDAVVIGVGTALADDPQLTVRHSDGTDPARVVLDPQGRLPAKSRCLAPNGARRIVVRAKTAHMADGAEQIMLPAENGTFAPHALIAALRERGFRRILIEGGPTTLSHFVAAGAVDRLHIMIAPIIIGSGPSGLQLPPIAHLAGSLRPRARVFRLPDDNLLCDCDLRP